jgi:hypothetical protein
MLSLKIKELSPTRDAVQLVFREDCLSFSRAWLIHTKRFSIVLRLDKNCALLLFSPKCLTLPTLSGQNGLIISGCLAFEVNAPVLESSDL